MEVGECKLHLHFEHAAFVLCRDPPPLLSFWKVTIALIANRVFFKTLHRSIKTSFMTKGHGQGVFKRKNY